MSIYIKRQSRELLCEVLPVVSGSWRLIRMYASHATIGLNINAVARKPSSPPWKGFGTLLCVGYQLYTSQFSEATTYIIGQVGPRRGGKSWLHPCPLENI